MENITMNENLSSLLLMYANIKFIHLFCSHIAYLYRRCWHSHWQKISFIHGREILNRTKRKEKHIQSVWITSCISILYIPKSRTMSRRREKSVPIAIISTAFERFSRRVWVENLEKQDFSSLKNIKNGTWVRWAGQKLRLVTNTFKNPLLSN